MTYQKIEGKKEDGECKNLENPKISHLTYVGFRTMLNQCEGVRTTIRFYYEKPFEEGEEPTLQFRFGVRSYYLVYGDNTKNPKPVENFLYDGKEIQVEPDGPGVNSDPNLHIFEEVFEEGAEHTMQFDWFLPADAVSGFIEWGTGSTGDTQGGSIGATANRLETQLPAAMDFRYVLHSEYLAARGFEQDEELTKDLDYGPGLPERKWATVETGIEGTTFDLIDCLERDGQQLANVRNSQPVNEIYPELPFDTETRFENKAGTMGFAQWPWQFFVYQDGQWDPKKGLRPMNRNAGNFDPYKKDDGSYMSLPYAPTLKSITNDIPGYEYVDNDITILEKASFDLNQPEGSYNYLPGPNVYLRRVGPHTTQHFYLTYKKIPGTFELEKQSVSFGQDDSQTREALEGAEFKLYQVVDETPSPCGLEPDLTDTEVVEVCAYQEPTTADELEDMMHNPKDCENKRVRPISLAGTDGSFITDEEGKFRPEGDPSLEPGDYLVREVSAPGEHLIVNEWIPFTVPLQTDEVMDPVKVYAENYIEPTPPPSEPPVTPSNPATPPETPGEPELPVTGVNVGIIGAVAVALFAAGLTLTLARRRK
ncbi:MAG: SpaA isopeptide-forming pilin-related protein [Actinomycetaceae bacterium]|nr:SpaA isopeptide-forming pilin-related protein [Actinomycetaceae bacterium]